NGGPFIYLSPARCGSGDVEKRADELRLPCVAVSNDREISDRFGRIDFHMFDSFQACGFSAEAYPSAKVKGKLGRVHAKTQRRKDDVKKEYSRHRRLCDFAFPLRLCVNCSFSHLLAR